MSACVRDVTPSVTWTTARVHATPPRSTGSQSELPARQRQPAEQPEDLVQVGAGVDEAAQRHVPGDAGEAVEPGDVDLPGWGPNPTLLRSVGPLPHAGRAAVRSHRRRRATAQAAPYPLSMPTTVIPDAHDASIASSAVTPSSAAP